jgi:hypothetical protein
MISIAILGIFTAGCAKSPESITAFYISDAKYSSLKCDELADERGRLEAALATASAQQDNARTNDTVGVVFLGLPVSSLSGENIAPEIARLKGEIGAVHTASLKHCPV